MNIAVILAGGRGLRLGTGTPKQMLTLGTKPVIAWSVDTFHNSGLIDNIIIVSEKSLMDDIKKLFPETGYPKISAFIEGGAERSDSSYNALVSSDFKDDDIFLFHDAARPFVSEEIIENVIIRTRESGACGTYIRSTDTIAIVKNSLVDYIPERSSVYSAQTPQGFRYRLIKEAHLQSKNTGGSPVTDDVSLVVNLGHKVSVADGSYKNIKITTDSDLRFARFLVSGKDEC